MATIGALWTQQHRPNLHSAGSWVEGSEDVHLTYMGTGAGFSGTGQLQQFCGLHPSQLHALNPAQLQRFDNALTPVTLLVDEQQQVVVEEALLSVFHHEPLEWLAPGVPATMKQLSVPLTFVAAYAGDRLRSVRVHWDQACVLKQTGALQAAATGRLPPAEALARLPIVSERQAAARLTAASPANANPLHPISEATRPAAKSTAP